MINKYNLLIFSYLELCYQIRQLKKFMFGLRQEKLKICEIVCNNFRAMIRAFLMQSNIYIIAFSLNN